MLNYIRCNLINKVWYQRHLLSYLLLPAAAVYYAIITLRKLLYKLGLKQVVKFNVPVVIVGNITVGGTGKTPLVIWLVEFLRQQGFKPGIVSRGYGGFGISYPYVVTPKSEVSQVGDEALLLARRTGCHMVISPRRVDAVEKLLASSDCNIVISDDGLQHYALGRDIEIVVLDGARGLGNRFLLPAGPLRERAVKLKRVDCVVTNGGNMQLLPDKLHSLFNHNLTRELTELKSKRVHAVAAIGNPVRFFQMLRDLGYEVVEHPFPDHHVFTAQDLHFAVDLPIIMTEKDAVKCFKFANKNQWYIPVTAKLDKDLTNKFQELLIKDYIHEHKKTSKKQQ